MRVCDTPDSPSPPAATQQLSLGISLWLQSILARAASAAMTEQEIWWRRRRWSYPPDFHSLWIRRRHGP